MEMLYQLSYNGVGSKGGRSLTIQPTAVNPDKKRPFGKGVGSGGGRPTAGQVFERMQRAQEHQLGQGVDALEPFAEAAGKLDGFQPVRASRRQQQRSRIPLNRELQQTVCCRLDLGERGFGRAHVHVPCDGERVRTAMPKHGEEGTGVVEGPADLVAELGAVDEDRAAFMMEPPRIQAETLELAMVHEGRGPIRVENELQRVGNEIDPAAPEEIVLADGFRHDGSPFAYGKQGLNLP